MSNIEEKKEPGRQMRFTDAELSILKNTFKGNEDLLKLLRKVFLPELDPDAPLGNQVDLWMTVKIDDIPTDQAIINLKARNSLIHHIEQQLLQIRILSELSTTPEEMMAKLKKDSNK